MVAITAVGNAQSAALLICRGGARSTRGLPRTTGTVLIITTTGIPHRPSNIVHAIQKPDHKK